MKSPRRHAVHCSRGNEKKASGPDPLSRDPPAPSESTDDEPGATRCDMVAQRKIASGRDSTQRRNAVASLAAPLNGAATKPGDAAAGLTPDIHPPRAIFRDSRPNEKLR